YRAISHSQLILPRGVRTEKGVAVEILRDESPVRRGRETRAKTGEACPPRRPAGGRRPAGIASIIVAQGTHLEPVVMPPGEARVIPGLAVDLMIKGDRRPSQAAEQRRRPIRQGKSTVRDHRTRRIVPGVC